MNKIGSVKDKNILLLQGPIGYFFKKLSTLFESNGATVYRIGFNAGDEFFSHRRHYHPYIGKIEEWDIFIRKFFLEKSIDKIFLFGDCRIYQSVAVAIALTLKIDVYVFEEGYVRPYYITMECYGVNDYSHLPREASFYNHLPLVALDKPKNVKAHPIRIWLSVIIYYSIAKLFHFKYKNYQHHRNYSAVQEFFYGTRSLVRKVYYTQRDKKYLNQIAGKLSKKYFFIPLQTHNDFQILQHSRYGSIGKFIIEVLESFANYAEKDVYLVFKHHPVDRGRKNYTNFIYEEAKELYIENKIIVMHDVHLPTCLKHAKGTVTINSTVGLSSIYHQTPTITLGNAIYDIEGLTNKGISLNNFWRNPKKPNQLLFKKFKQYLIQNTQLNGSFYGLIPEELK